MRVSLAGRRRALQMATHGSPGGLAAAERHVAPLSHAALPALQGVNRPSLRALFFLGRRRSTPECPPPARFHAAASPDDGASPSPPPVVQGHHAAGTARLQGQLGAPARRRTPAYGRQPSLGISETAPGCTALRPSGRDLPILATPRRSGPRKWRPACPPATTGARPSHARHQLGEQGAPCRRGEAFHGLERPIARLSHDSGRLDREHGAGAPA
ncbi:hypothetical protein J2X65_001272 [Ancylobacter sp. 3268]|nr:hypothetical protein [Ancylobacter sp. 3268]